MKWGSCEEALAIVRDAHQQALAVAVLLEDKIERLNHSLSCGHQCSGSHRHLSSHWQRSQTVSHQTKVPQVVSCQGEPTRWWAQFPNPLQLRWKVTFKDSLKKDARAEETPPTNLRDEEEQAFHPTGPDQKPDQKRRTLSACPLLILMSKSSWEGKRCLWLA